MGRREGERESWPSQVGRIQQLNIAEYTLSVCVSASVCLSPALLTLALNWVKVPSAPKEKEEGEGRRVFIKQE